MITTRLKINPQKQSVGVADVALSLLRQSEGGDSVLTAIQKNLSLSNLICGILLFSCTFVHKSKIPYSCFEKHLTNHISADILWDSNDTRVPRFFKKIFHNSDFKSSSPVNVQLIYSTEHIRDLNLPWNLSSLPWTTAQIFKHALRFMYCRFKTHVTGGLLPPTAGTSLPSRTKHIQDDEGHYCKITTGDFSHWGLHFACFTWLHPDFGSSLQDSSQAFSVVEIQH